MSLEYQQNYVTASYEDALLRLFEGRYDDNFQASPEWLFRYILTMTERHHWWKGRISHVRDALMVLCEMSALHERSVNGK